MSGNFTISILCEDWSGNTVDYSANIVINQSLECISNCSEVGKDTKDSSESSIITTAVILLIIAILVIGVLVNRGRNDNHESETWQNEQDEPERDDRIPQGWTLQEFLNWLDGPMPEEWQEEQWELYRQSLEDLR